MTLPMTSSSSNRGTVLIMVLWVLAAVSMLALSFAGAIRVEIEAARTSVNQRQAYYLTRAGVEYSIFKLLESQAAFVQGRRQAGATDDLESETSTKHYTLQLPMGIVEIDALPENGKLNLNRANADLIYNTLIMIGIGLDQADVIANSIQDWKDRDDLVTQGTGAESDYYGALEVPYFAKNSNFSVPEELLLVRGVTPEIYYGIKGLTSDGEPAELFGLQKYFTTFGGGQRVDLNSAPVQIIAAIPGLDYQDALRIDELRNSMPITNLSDVTSRLPGVSNSVMAFMSVERNTAIYSIDAVGRLGEGKAASRIRCVVQLGGRNAKRYSVFYWNEANVEL